MISVQLQGCHRGAAGAAKVPYGAFGVQFGSSSSDFCGITKVS